MKKIVVSAAVVAMFATTAFAGSLVEPEMEPMVEVMQEEPAGTSDGGLLVPLLALAAIAVLISSSSDSTTN